MSKRKDRKIKRLQRLPIWPVIVEMIITELVIFSLAVFICALASFGIINTLVLNNAKECRAVIQYVNENWESLPRSVIDSRLSEFVESYDDINGIYIDEHNDALNVFPKLKGIFNDEEKWLFENTGIIHFIDPEEKSSISEMIFVYDSDDSYKEKIADSEARKIGYAVGNNIKTVFYNPKKLFRSMNLPAMLRDKDFISWALTEINGLPVVAIYKTDIPNLILCVKSVYKLNSFQFNLLVTVMLFFILVFIFSEIYEITKLVNLVGRRKRVNRLVTIDTVTGGYNKEYFMQKVRKEIARGRRQYAVVQLRLEKYRNYCTAYGLKQGENLLEEINFTLVDMLDKKEFVAHIEKSDFILLLSYQTEDALNIRVRNMMNILRERRGSQHLTFSAGVCPVRLKTDDVSVLLTCAGIAVPKSIKIQDEVVWFSDSMKEEQIWERRIEDDMEIALENHEFQVYLQPKYSTKEEVLSAAEALVRWNHPVLGFVSPGKFIPIFEKNGFILQLDDYMLTEVAKLQANWAAQGKKLVPISVNVSRAHFAEDNLADHICSIIDKYNVPHEYIELELTESAFFDDKNVLLTTVRKLKSFGFKVSMDDFGAGYSSLNSLKELPLDIIKLDAEFFRSVDDIERSNLIVGQTISLAKKLGMEIVAEGIETREQVDFLAKQDCDLIQGFYFSKPLPVSEFEEKAYPQE